MYCRVTCTAQFLEFNWLSVRIDSFLIYFPKIAVAHGNDVYLTSSYVSAALFQFFIFISHEIMCSHMVNVTK